MHLPAVAGLEGNNEHSVLSPPPLLWMAKSLFLKILPFLRDSHFTEQISRILKLINSEEVVRLKLLVRGK